SVSAILFGAALWALLDASSEAWVAIALIVSGFVGGAVDLLMNAEGARIERRLGRPILARLHAAASAGMALGAILGSLIVVGPAPWAAGIVAALGLAGAGVAYHRAARTDRPPSAAVGSIGRSGLSFAPALIGLGVVVGVSIAAELAASVWSSLLLRQERPSWRRFPASARRSFPPARLRCGSTSTRFAFGSATFASSSPRSRSPRPASLW